MSENSSNIKFADDFCDFASNLLIERDVLFLGGFNIHVNNQEDVDAIHFIEMTEALGLDQMSNFQPISKGTIWI